MVRTFGKDGIGALPSQTAPASKSVHSAAEGCLLCRSSMGTDQAFAHAQVDMLFRAQWQPLRDDLSVESQSVDYRSEELATVDSARPVTFR